ncbi:MAG: hypothetical protein SRB2_02952 [Desulfobacteraceae bacterium Eth-SRB2]|nr:MAG: hypothetical protein SRB2_02952 [Desulfobacteraceae bacterium Eth-SRB2]
MATRQACIYVYVLDPKFRDIIDCQQKPCDPFSAPTIIGRKVEELRRCFKTLSKWHPDLWSGGVMEETPFFIALRKQIPGENLKI